MVLPACRSEKSSPVVGSGTIPGSESTALKWDTEARKIIVLKITALKAPQSL